MWNQPITFNSPPYSSIGVALKFHDKRYVGGGEICGRLLKPFSGFQMLSINFNNGFFVIHCTKIFCNAAVTFSFQLHTRGCHTYLNSVDRVHMDVKIVRRNCGNCEGVVTCLEAIVSNIGLTDFTNHVFHGK